MVGRESKIASVGFRDNEYGKSCFWETVYSCNGMRIRFVKRFKIHFQFGKSRFSLLIRLLIFSYLGQATGSLLIITVTC